jgi:pilus assembly protein Flp/PilA
MRTERSRQIRPLLEVRMQLKRTRRILHTFATDDRGATVIEYALVAIIVSVAIIASLTAIRGSLNSSFSSVVAGFSHSSP